MFLSLNSHVVMLSIACPLRYPLKAIQFILDSSLMPFTSLLSYMMQLLHSLMLIHHLLYPSLTLLLCFRRLPSEPQGRAYNPELLQATVLPSRHGLARVWIIPSANRRSHLLHGPYLLFSLATLWRVACTSFLDCAPSLLPSPCHGGRRSSLARASARLESPHSLHMLLFVCRDASPPLA